MTKITLSQLKEMKPCDLTKVNGIDWSKEPVGVKEAIAAGVSVEDILWVAGKLASKDKVILYKIVQFAKWCAEEAEKNSSSSYAAATHAADAAADAAAADAAADTARVASCVASCAAYAASCAAYYAAANASCDEIKKQKQKLIELFS